MPAKKNASKVQKKDKADHLESVSHNSSVNNENWDSFRPLIRDTVHGYIFWCIIHGFVPMVWFFPMNNLAISGYEAIAVVLFSPLIAAIPGVLGLLQNRWILGFLRMCMVASLASFQAPTKEFRFFIIGAGAGVALLVFTALMWSPSQRIRSSTLWGLILGFFSLVASRVWYTSFIPAWWDYQSNAIVIALGVIAVSDHIIAEADKVDQSQPPSCSLYSVPNGLGAGCLWYLTWWCFGESSLITRWVVKGYPDHGPMPYPWGAVVFLCLAVGIFLSRFRPLAQSKVWWLVGAASLAALYYLPTWQGLAGGLVLSVYTMSIWPEMIDRLCQSPPVRTMLVLALIFLAQVFFFVWTIAYNFVPGGEYTREHTDWLVVFVSVGIFFGLFVGKGSDESHTSYVKIKDRTQPTWKVFVVLVLVVLAGLGGFGWRCSRQVVRQPKLRPSNQFTAGISAIRFGYDNNGWPSFERLAKVWNNTGADFITLVESDASKPFHGNNDLGMWLGEKLGMYVDFGPSTRDHTWGNLVLSKYPIVKSTHHLMPSPHGELAPAVTGTLNIHGSLVDFVVAHNGNEEDALDRKLQTEFIAKQLRNSTNPVMFLGYVTSAPYSNEYRTLVEGGDVNDIDSTDQQRWCLYIMYRKLIRVGYARISHGGLSDTEIQLGRFQIPDDFNTFKDNNRVTTDPDQVPKDVRFNKKFGKLYHGHGYFTTQKFHMGTPKYFIRD